MYPKIEKFNYDKIEEFVLSKDFSNYYKELLFSHENYFYAVIGESTFVITKEKSVFELTNKSTERFDEEFKKNVFFSTVLTVYDEKIYAEEIFKFLSFQKRVLSCHPEQVSGIVFGCVAMKLDEGVFIISTRGKKSLDDYALVRVNFDEKKVYASKKAPLNAPLIAYLFNEFKNSKYIVHHHYFDEKLKTAEYQFPGTVLDSERNVDGSFNIEHHGVIYIYDKYGNLL